MQLKAPAKINLTLEVTGRDDRGYHTLDTIFAWLELHDSLRLQKSSKTSLRVVAQGVPIDLVAENESNLVLRALRALEAISGRELATEIELIKRIPTGGGLGGGSADAAATLIGLNKLHGLALEQEQLEKAARSLGADVAFGLVGGLARGLGYGDRLERLAPLADLLERELLLLAPDFSCSTPEVYRLWDQHPSHQAQGSTARFLTAEVKDRLKHLKNDLQPPAQRLYPQLAKLADKMCAAGLEGVSLSGSGSTLFGFLPLEMESRKLKESLAGLGRLFFTRLRKEGRNE